jgi:hypothetical protein
MFQEPIRITFATVCTSVLAAKVSYFVHFSFKFCLLFAQLSFSNSIFSRLIIKRNFQRSYFEVETDLLYIIYFHFMLQTLLTQQNSLTRMRWNKVDVWKPSRVSTNYCIFCFSKMFRWNIKKFEGKDMKNNKASGVDQVWVKAFVPRHHHENSHWPLSWDFYK